MACDFIKVASAGVSSLALASKAYEYSFMPLRWVVRKDVVGRETAPALRAFVEGAIVAEPGLRTVDQCVASLLGEGEECEGVTDKRPIRKDGKLIGYIDITR